MTQDDKRLANLLRHVSNVRDDCLLLGTRLMQMGESELGRRLIANGMIHDASKFYGVEWEYLNESLWPFPEDDPREALFKAAQRQHVSTNLHHPEVWAGGVEEMDRLHLAEMVVDWKARSNEQGTCLLDWVKDKASMRFGFPTSGRVYKELKGFIDLLLEKRF